MGTNGLVTARRAHVFFRQYCIRKLVLAHRELRRRISRSSAQNGRTTRREHSSYRGLRSKVEPRNRGCSNVGIFLFKTQSRITLRVGAALCGCFCARLDGSPERLFTRGICTAKSSAYQKPSYPEEDGNYYHSGYVVSPQRRGIYGR